MTDIGCDNVSTPGTKSVGREMLFVITLCILNLFFKFFKVFQNKVSVGQARRPECPPNGHMLGKSGLENPDPSSLGTTPLSLVSTPLCTHGVYLYSRSSIKNVSYVTRGHGAPLVNIPHLVTVTSPARHQVSARYTYVY